MMSWTFRSSALAFIASLMLAPLPAHSIDYADGAKVIAGVCPALVKRDLPNATPQDSEAICGCMREKLAASAKDYPTALPTQQQWAELGIRAATQCMAPHLAQMVAQQCTANATWRQQLTSSARINDAQFDRYCHCHAKLAADETAKGTNLSDPEVRRVLKDKSYTQCLAPLRAEKPAN